MKIHSHILLEAKSLKSVSLGQNQGDVLPPEALEENPLVASLALGSFQQSLTFGHITSVSASVITHLLFWLCFLLCICEISLFLSLTETHMLPFRVHLDNLGRPPCISLLEMQEQLITKRWFKHH